MNVFLLVFGLLLTTLGILFLRGKGLFLVAGYNTMSSKEKDLIDPKKLSKVMAIFMFLMALMFILGSFDTRYMAFLALPSLAFILGFVILGQRIVLNDEGKKVYDAKPHRLKYFLGLPLYLLAMIFFFDLLYMGNVEVLAHDGYFSIKSDKYKEVSIDYRDIEQISYEKDYKIGHKINGVNNFKVSLGKYENEGGRYLLYSENNAERYLLIKVKGLGLVVYGASEEEVSSLYDLIETNS